MNKQVKALTEVPGFIEYDFLGEVLADEDTIAYTVYLKREDD